MQSPLRSADATIIQSSAAAVHVAGRFYDSAYCSRGRAVLHERRRKACFNSHHIVARAAHSRCCCSLRWVVPFFQVYCFFAVEGTCLKGPSPLYHTAPYSTPLAPRWRPASRRSQTLCTATASVCNAGQQTRFSRTQLLSLFSAPKNCVNSSFLFMRGKFQTGMV